MNTHGPHSGDTQSRVFYKRGLGQPGFLIVRNMHAPRVCKDDPDGVHGHREEMIEEQDGIWCETSVFRHYMRGKKDARKREETHPESNETGPRMHSPPRSKYLKHPVRRMARY